MPNELTDEDRDDPVVEWMLKSGGPLTRKRYLGLCYPEGTPEPWTFELEQTLPPIFRQELQE